MAKALADHRGAILINWPSQTRRSGLDALAPRYNLKAAGEDAVARKIALQLASDNCLAFYWSDHGALAPNDAGICEVCLPV